MSRAKVHRHPSVIAFLISSWLANWVELLLFFGNVQKPGSPGPRTHTNVPDGPIKALCNANALLIAYFWVLVPGFAMVFVIEVLRLLFGLWRFTNKNSTTSSLHRLAPEQTMNQRSYTTETIDNFDNVEKGRANTAPLIHRNNPFMKLINRKNRYMNSNNLKHWFYRFQKTFWKLFPYSPILTALPGPIIIGISLGKSGFKEVHANHFVCSTTEIEAQRKLGIVGVISLAPTSFFGIFALIVYIYLHFKTPPQTRSPLRSPLLLKLGVVSVVTAFGGFLQWFIKATAGGYRGSGLSGYGQWPPLYMVFFPVICAAVFIEKAILEEWKSWIKFKN
ncbi:hypothetical protein CROQUDRAFT_136535 [Cronartium quercuum f. sp. fusiforme G11]|uniref:Uncharacterized protein n=1 Tax=Cronartium quercuum f. sp. fusiforme G11 TaxID=708437 RepID=A0A9P6NBL4_9BASI|nr:hypothetical protein CROQUDRAFT_136535 [Cronartium quercuum f. sp. fusiforme G11]